MRAVERPLYAWPLYLTFLIAVAFVKVFFFLLSFYFIFVIQFHFAGVEVDLNCVSFHCEKAKRVCVGEWAWH